MSRKKLLRRLRKYHKWPSIVLSLFTLLFAVSGIVMNHRSFFSSIDVNRKYLPQNYKYNNWNNSAVKSACKIGHDSILVYGNIGVWLTNDSLTDFRDFNQGFPTGVDNRKIYKVHQTTNGNVYAGTLFGLYKLNLITDEWNKVDGAFGKVAVVDLLDKNDTLYVLTRSFIYKASDKLSNLQFEKITLPEPVGYKNQEGLFKTLWVIHSGEIGGLAGKLLVDLIGLLFIFLTFTGLIYWLFPKWIKKRKRKDLKVKNIVKVNRFSLKWHNKIGVWVVLFLMITTLTGMFLRPPLLIAIASIGKIPFTVLDNDNPWNDKLRRFLYDAEKDRFLIGTNQGIYAAPKNLKGHLQTFQSQPPVSVMGINVFEQMPHSSYLVGSFSGLYLWNAETNRLKDFLHPQKIVAANTGGPPIGFDVSAGFIGLENNQMYHFDYDKGVKPINNDKPFPTMPDEIVEQSPISLWNLALEFHTARIYSLFLGDFYILFIPLYGLSMLLILITGVWVWWKVYR